MSGGKCPGGTCPGGFCPVTEEVPACMQRGAARGILMGVRSLLSLLVDALVNSRKGFCVCTHKCPLF